MIGEPLGSPRRRYPGAVGILLAIAALIAGALLLFQPWAGDQPPDLVLQFAPTATETPAATAPPLPTATSTPTAVPTAPAETITPQPRMITHTVQIGDMLSVLAREFGVSVERIAAASGIEPEAILQPGQVLTIPLSPALAPSGVEPSSPQTPASTPDATQTPAEAESEKVVLYEVQAGDVLSAIAAQYGVPIEVIVEANDLQDPELLQVGQQLRVPLGTPTPAPTSTPRPTATATAGPPFPAPLPRGPSDGETVFAGEDDETGGVLLNWTAVGLLAEDEWYLVQLWEGRPPAGRVVAEKWTRETSWRVPAEVLAGAENASREFHWFVILARRAEAGDEEEAGVEPAWEPLSPPSETHRFIWSP